MLGEQDRVDLAKLGKGFRVAIESHEPPQELESRLRREEADAAHQRRKDFILTASVLALITTVSAACLVFMALPLGSADTQKSAASLLTVIVSATAGYVTGKGAGGLPGRRE